ncbi:PglL family O-oligosaccharyltransferase [Serratia proteamaculans]|uniref:PglL family O-oligosaccharyltransferase n=1 Tax=Serratia proteamaculans TaxID=28151 RepID=UPI002177B2BF|nr:O-antigen ligase family protein [Serratia proteamaculans]CAI1980594.1 Lipid A core - O-antigen ligase and related enzymes [Serratia proteamaculans]
MLRRNKGLVACFIGLPIVSWCYFPNMGGVGLSLPFNPLVYAVMAVMVLLIWCGKPRRRGIVFTPTARCLTMGVVLLAVPLAYGPAAGFSSAAWRVAALLAGWIFYCSGLQVRLPFRLRQPLLVVLLAIVAGQAVIAVLQLFLPAWSWVPLRGARVYGIFQQPNVLGSFIATGLALTLMQWLLPGYALVASRREGARRIALSLLLVLFSAVLVWIQSRAAWLATLLVVLGFWGCFRHHFTRGLLSASLLILLGTALGGVVMLWPESAGGVRYISHEMSNQARLAMLQDTLKMIAAHPLSGWGYGSFEYAFQHFRIEQVPPTQVLEIARHPHNEILYWWVEGGLVALLGISLLILGGGRLLLQAIRHDRRAFSGGAVNAGEASALCLALLPMLVHTQLEYPFYLSAMHWMVFLLLLAMADRLSCRKIGVIILPARGRLPLRCGIGGLCMATLVMMVAIFRGGLSLTQAERNGLRDIQILDSMSPIARWGLQDRVNFDAQTHRLLTYNTRRDDSELSRYAVWARHYLTRRVDANVYASLIAILRYQQQTAEAEKYGFDAALLFPADPRFRRSTATTGE